MEDELQVKKLREKEGTVEQKDGSVTIFAPTAKAGTVDPFSTSPPKKKKE